MFNLSHFMITRINCRKITIFWDEALVCDFVRDPLVRVAEIVVFTRNMPLYLKTDWRLR